jgi:hypothetical protein
MEAKGVFQEVEAIPALIPASGKGHPLLSNGHSLLQFFKPVQDDVDFAGASGCRFVI